MGGNSICTSNAHGSSLDVVGNAFDDARLCDDADRPMADLLVADPHMAPLTPHTPQRRVHAGTATLIKRDPLAAYNCHSFAWHAGQGDPIDPANAATEEGRALYERLPRWDDSPWNDMRRATQLGPLDAVEIGDVLVYADDVNGNGRIDADEAACAHSALVTVVDELERAVRVMSKESEDEVTDHHPARPHASYVFDGRPQTWPTTFDGESMLSERGPQPVQTPFSDFDRWSHVRNVIEWYRPALTQERMKFASGK